MDELTKYRLSKLGPYERYDEIMRHLKPLQTRLMELQVALIEILENTEMTAEEKTVKAGPYILETESIIDKVTDFRREAQLS